MAHPKKFEMFGRLANSKEFREKLVLASKYPESKRAKKLNAQVGQMFAMVGKTIPFSAHERAHQ
jgi:hypothetical protein